MTWSSAPTWPSGDARTFTPANDQWNDPNPNFANGTIDTPAFSDNNGDGEYNADGANHDGAGGGASGNCFNCGSDSHQKRDCPEPRKFTGECRSCGEVGHPAKECPSKPKKCRQCLMENDHDTIDCKNKKVIDMTDVPDMSEKDAWNMIRQACNDREVGDFKEALKILSKANSDITYLDIEAECRKRKLSIYLIGLKKDVDPAYTNTNLQGEVGKTYQVGYYFSHLCQRPILMSLWPKDIEENKTRLADAGVPLPRGVIICGNCNKPGHGRKACPDPIDEGPGATKIMCALCNEEGHRVRDCTRERKKPRGPRTCKICGSEEHLVAECPDKPKMMCRNCEQEGHKASECENERVIRCRNCEQVGHLSKECPLPTDWSKVKCRNCGEFGHTHVRCKMPPKEDTAGDAGDNAGNNGEANGNNSFQAETVDHGSGGQDWQNGSSGNAASASAW